MEKLDTGIFNQGEVVFHLAYFDIIRDHFPGNLNNGQTIKVFNKFACHKSVGLYSLIKRVLVVKEKR
jgi:hypothetical protein